jgi:hypothetical protein
MVGTTFRSVRFNSTYVSPYRAVTTRTLPGLWLYTKQISPTGINNATLQYNSLNSNDFFASMGCEVKRARTDSNCVVETIVYHNPDNPGLFTLNLSRSAILGFSYNFNTAFTIDVTVNAISVPVSVVVGQTNVVILNAHPGMIPGNNNVSLVFNFTAVGEAVSITSITGPFPPEWGLRFSNARSVCTDPSILSNSLYFVQSGFNAGAYRGQTNLLNPAPITIFKSGTFGPLRLCQDSNVNIRRDNLTTTQITCDGLLFGNRFTVLDMTGRYTEYSNRYSFSLIKSGGSSLSLIHISEPTRR